MAHATVTETPKMSVRARLESVDQSFLVLGLIVLMIAFGTLTTEGFFRLGNFGVVLNFAAAPGIVAIGLAFVILGRGIDLSVGAIALASGQVLLELMTRGWSEWSAILVVLIATVIFGLFNGLLTAYVGVPALIVTLGTGLLLIGTVKVWLLSTNLYVLPKDSSIENLGTGNILGVPSAIFIAGIVFIAAWLIWSYTPYGQLLRATGDNFDAARNTGAPVRTVQVSSYVISALLATLAGFMIAAREGSVTTTGTAFSPLLFSALTAVVIGGVSLSGGRGTILGVLVGTIFIGLVTNLLTLNNLSPSVQGFVRGAILLIAVVLDAWLHPRDEETAKSGEL